jgi:hypothetical protein
MNFHLSVWNKHRSQALILGNHIQSYKDKNGIIKMDRDTLEGYIAHITCILKECSIYMDKCGLTRPTCLWKYDTKDPTTHPSSKAFLYKDRMSKQAIKAYGEGFMTEDVKEPKKEKKAA